MIDLSSRNKDVIVPKFSLIQDAIEARQTISFDYYAPSGDTHREMEPYNLIFKWSSWYVYGFCLMRRDFRLFKLNRMNRIRCTGQIFSFQKVSLPDFSIHKLYSPEKNVKALVSPDVKWRLIEEFGSDCFTEMEDGRLLFSGFYSDMESLLAWILTFGDQMEVLEPAEVKDKLLCIVNSIKKIYEDDEHE